MDSRRLRVVACVAVLACLSVIGWLAVGLGGPRVTALGSGVLMITAALVAGFRGLIAATRADGRAGRAWALLGAGSLLWAFGQTVQAAYELAGHAAPFPSVSDVWHLCAWPLWIAGLLMLPTAPVGLAGRLRSVLDGLLVACSVVFVCWGLMADARVSANVDVTTEIVRTAYPAFDLVALSLVFVLVVRSRRGRRLDRNLLPLVLVAVAFGGFLVADAAFAYQSLAGTYRTGVASDAGWFVGFVCLALAALPAMSEAPGAAADKPSRELGVLLPCIAVVLALWLTMDRQLSGRLDAVLVWDLALLLALLAARLLLTLLENHRLTRTLEHRVEQRTNQLMAHESRFRSLVQYSSDVITIIDEAGVIRYQSASVERVFGYLPASMVGAPIRRLLAEADVATFNSLLQRAMHQPYHPVVGEVSVWRGDGELRPAEMTMTSLLLDPAVRGIVLNSRDVGDRRQLERELLHQAFHDPLTALANRSLFRDRVEHALAQFGRRQRPLSVLFVDLDGFKSVNDSLGHAAGDALLVSVADRLLSCVRLGDTVARLGGDEFALLVEEVEGEHDAIALADRILEMLREPITVDNNQVFVGGSIGVVTTTTGLETSGELLRNADLAMYRAKAAGKNGYQRYEPGMHSAVMQRMQLEADLRDAIDKGQFVLHYQPTVDLRTGRLAGVEALLRWWHPVQGIVAPSQFIPLAEETGLIVPIGEWALREACLQGARWEAQYGSGVYVAVNLSARQLQDPGLLAMIADALDRASLRPDQLVLELTESMLMDESDELIATLRMIRGLGVQLAIDDFGTGYSSLSYLHRFPVDILKVDRAFVGRIAGRDDDDGLAGTIVRLGQSLELKIIAEGIEDYDQFTALQSMGCHFGQGFYFARPYEARQIDVMLAAGGVFSLSPNSPRARKSGVPTAPSPILSARPDGMVVPMILPSATGTGG